jgi:hypothetical protein
MSAPVVTQADRDAAQVLCASGWTHAIEAFARHRTAAEAASAATVAELVEALEIAWAEAHKMRNASKLVGPYPNDRAATRVWERSLYHAGKDLCAKLKPYRNAARVKATEQGEG